jgi:hypothetical protein
MNTQQTSVQISIENKIIIIIIIKLKTKKGNVHTDRCGNTRRQKYHATRRGK